MLTSVGWSCNAHGNVTTKMTTGLQRLFERKSKMAVFNLQVHLLKLNTVTWPRLPHLDVQVLDGKIIDISLQIATGPSSQDSNYDKINLAEYIMNFPKTFVLEAWLSILPPLNN